MKDILSNSVFNIAKNNMHFTTDLLIPLIYLFIENLLVIEIRKTETLINKPVYLGLSILDLSKPVIYEFWADYVKQKYVENVKPCYLDIDSFIVHVKTYNIYKYITEDAETMFDNSNFELDRPLLKGKNKKSNQITEI